MWLIRYFLIRIITILTIFSEINTFDYFLSENKELIYNWNAEIKAGTYHPATFTSQFSLQAQIHLQKSSNTGSILVKIANVTQKLYNGILDHKQEYDIKFSSIPEEVKDLGNVFQISYNDVGLITNIVTQNGEKEFSRNIKKAIAGIFQIEASVLLQEFIRPESFSFEENSIYGFQKVNYFVHPHEQGIEVRKIQDMSKSIDENFNMISNGNFEHCDVKPEQNVMQDSAKVYLICKKENEFVIKNITTSGSIVYYPFKAKSDAQFIEVSQIFHFVNSVPIEEEFQLDSENVTLDLRYTSYRSKIDNFEKILPVLQQTLEAIYQYSQENHINTQEPDANNGQLINQAQRILSEFSYEQLEQIRRSLSPNILETFYQMLPLVDTDDADLLIRDLIISKNITSDLSIQLLQNMADNSRLFEISKLEPLINLNDSYSWEVRKVAILRFGTIIHKSYLYSKKMNEIFQKYVTEYITRLRASDDYKIQQVYILGLRNMKLPILLDSLLPAINGEWWEDVNLRYLSLWAAGSPSTGLDSDSIFTKLWPMVSNRDETTDIRILSYLFLMQSRPTESRLRTISNYMLSEENQELYNFHYTYLQAIARSTEPCLCNLRQSLERVLKFTPPAKYGFSNVNNFGYNDINYDFGTNFENYYIRSNTSRVFNSIFKTQQFNRYQEELSIYWKIYSTDDTFFKYFETDIADILYHISKSRFRREISKRKGLMECAVIKKGQVVDSYYFKESGSLIMFYYGLSLRMRDGITFNSLHTNYIQYHKAVIPTDLGFPVHWEFLMPVVLKNNLTLKRNDKNTEFDVHNKFTTAIHYQHGLKFYNPVTNLWQGIKRYQYFDASLPLRLTVNQEAEIFSLTWKRPEEVVGLRSYVKQMTFIRDCNYKEEYKLVTAEHDFKHNYTFINKVGPNSGLRYYLGLYDSTIRVSNGSLKHKLELFGSHHTKEFNSPSQYFILTASNLLRYFLFLPQSGTYGVIAQASPSLNDSITGIQLSAKYDLNVHKKDFLFSALDFDFLVNYTVLKAENNLPNWSLTGNLSVEAGHLGGRLGMELATEDNLKLYFNAERTITHNRIDGNLNVTADGGENIIEITEVGERSSDQLDGTHKYGRCDYVMPYSWSNFYTFDCLVDQTTVRQYYLDVNTNNNKIKEWLKFFQGYFQSYAFSIDNNSNSSRTSIDVSFPIDSPDEIDFQISLSGKKYGITGVPNTFLKWFGVFPESTVYPTLFLFWQRLGLSDQLIIYENRLIFNGKSLKKEIDENTTLQVETDPITNIHIKKINNQDLTFKIELDNRTLEVIPNNGKLLISADGGVVSPGERLEEDWLYYNLLKKDNREAIVIFVSNGVHLEYYVDRLEILSPIQKLNFIEIKL